MAATEPVSAVFSSYTCSNGVTRVYLQASITADKTYETLILNLAGRNMVQLESAYFFVSLSIHKENKG